MTCKDCLGNYLGYCKIDCLCPDKCENFQDRSLWVKLPCKMGDTVYAVYHELSGEKELIVGRVERFNLYSTDHSYVCVYYEDGDGLSYWHTPSDFGKVIFLTREEAERALKDRSGE